MWPNGCLASGKVAPTEEALPRQLGRRAPRECEVIVEHTEELTGRRDDLAAADEPDRDRRCGRVRVRLDNVDRLPCRVEHLVAYFYVLDRTQAERCLDQSAGSKAIADDPGALDVR